MMELVHINAFSVTFYFPEGEKTQRKKWEKLFLPKVTLLLPLSFRLPEMIFVPSWPRSNPSLEGP